MEAAAFVSVRNLVKTFPIKGGLFSKEVASVKAVSNISFEIKRGETLGLVGESGCGKSTLGRCILRLIEPTSGTITFNGLDVTTLPQDKMRKLRRKMQIIFQDPYASLNPRMNVEEIVGEPLEIHELYSQSREQRRKRIKELLDCCGLRSDILSRYPHEFSGGQRQRICIARALAVEPEFIVCDEPVSALDVSIQAQIINLLEDLQKEFKLTYLFIAHDLKVVEHISTRVAVMYLGQIVELAKADELYTKPKHPYTKALLSAIPIPDLEYRKERVILKGEVPSPITPPSGCYFSTRCPIKTNQCELLQPRLDAAQQGVDSTHFVSCHLAKE
ncbi:MAG: peptide ABC transporter substrate-binding protein [Bdellovibrionales bacterium RIFOXYD1_FULL_44_7]|nr:MAG: peptide ABC transporter substrate-binding protein [Bdellovibrionales bacterium RIFOXYD1_FULL_44_7]